MFKNLFDTVDDFVHNPVGSTIDIITQPVRDGIEVLEGLTEGEIRHKAALRLGADVVSGMALSEIIDLIQEEDDWLI